VTDQLVSGYSRADSISAAYQIKSGCGRGNYGTVNRSGDGLGCAAGDVDNAPQADEV